MPHQCIECDQTFPDGSKEMLSGCPACGGNKFQFKPESADQKPATTGTAETTETTAPEADTDTDNASVNASSSSPSSPSSPNPRPWPGTESEASSASSSDTDAPKSPDDTETTTDSGEDTAQASARSAVVTDDELDRASRDVVTTDGAPDDTRSQPDVDDLREELNDQFESIRIVSPGQYELNLMELYDRQEYIISLREDGRYVIQMADGWGPDS